MLQTGTNEHGVELHDGEINGATQQLRLLESMQDTRSPVEKVSKDAVSFTKMKQLFYEMSEIDNDPESDAARKYHELADKVQVIRPAHVMLKEMKATSTPQWGYDGNG